MLKEMEFSLRNSAGPARELTPAGAYTSRPFVCHLPGGILWTPLTLGELVAMYECPLSALINT